MDSVNDILDKNRFVEPSESIAIKTYVKTKFKSVVGISVNQNTITIISTSAALASTLRLDITQLNQIIPPGKKIIFG